MLLCFRHLLKQLQRIYVHKYLRVDLSRLGLFEMMSNLARESSRPALRELQVRLEDGLKWTIISKGSSLEVQVVTKANFVH